MLPEPLNVPPPGPDGLPPGWPSDFGVPTLAPDVLAWAETELAQPDGEHAGEPWRWRESQARFLAWWFAVDRAGRFLWRRGQVVASKGAGKSPIAAGVSCCALAGPVQFDGWDAHGQPVGRPHASPFVQLAAVSQDQTDNTMSLVMAMLRDGHAARSVPGLDIGLTRVRTAHGILQPVTASAPSREGQRITDAVLDESHLWTRTNGGHRLAATLRRNLGKMDGRSLETTNVWIPGEQSVAEMTWDYAQALAAGKAVSAPGDRGVLRWHPSVAVTNMADPVELRAALAVLYGDSPWVSVDRLVAEILDLGTDVEDAQRFYLNQITAASDAWLTATDVSACVTSLRAEPGDLVALGFDGSRGRTHGKPDATALIGCRLSDGLLFELGVWEALDNARDTWRTWEPPLADIEATIAHAFKTYSVAAFYCDPARDWRSYVNGWEATYGPSVKVRASQAHPFEWWMTGGRATPAQQAILQLEGAFRNHDVLHDGSMQLVRHLLNARRRTVHGKLALGKSSDHSERKIDAAVAAVLAYQARLDAVARGAAREQRRSFVPSRIR